MNDRPIITRSPLMDSVLRSAEIVSRRATPVLITGETGTGKELLARRIHDLSARSRGPFVALNCAAIPRDLIEAELFGHERGAFTGALARKLGRFERANGGTLLLYEIGDLALDLQAKLLRVLQEKEIERIGGSSSVPVDVRIIAATHRDLRKMADEGAFREDLYYRLSVVPIRMPSLRERPEDVDVLTDYFLEKFADRPLRVTDEARALLRLHTWPGNVRELENVIHRAAMLVEGDEITTETLRSDPSTPQRTGDVIVDHLVGLTLEEVERHLLRATLEKTGGNQKEAARILGVSRRTVYAWLRDMETECARVVS